LANFNNSFTDELRARLSIVDIIGRVVPLTKKGQNYWGCCPFHGEKTPSFSVREDWGKYHCFGCGESGDIISFTMKHSNMDFKSAIAELAQAAGLKLPDYKPKAPEQIAREKSYLEITDAAAKIYQQKLYEESGAAALSYIRGRGFDDAKIKKYGIGYAPKNNIVSAKFANEKIDNLIATGLVRRGDYGAYDFFRDKLMFPITNAKGEIIAFSGRSLDRSEPKYINTADTELFHKRGTIFGLSFARDAIHRANRSIVVEGQIDAIQMQTNGFPETVAPLGTALTEEHIAILCKHNRNITFCFDGDKAGQKASARALSLCMPVLRADSDIRFAFCPNGQDADDILKKSPADMKKIIYSAMELADFLWKIANTDFNTKTELGQTGAHKFLMSEIDKITDEARKSAMRQNIKDREWNEWHKNFKKNAAENIAVPAASDIEKNTLSAIAEKYPALIEKHSEFLFKIGADLGGGGVQDIAFQLSESDSEKFIVALKLKNHIKNLQTERVELLKQMTAESFARIKIIDSEIADANEKMNRLSEA
jgi:DNA primase